MLDDYISRETLRTLMHTEAFERDTGLQRWDSGLWIRYKLFENCIDAIPAADVVEVVRCRDCEWWGHAGCAISIVDDTDKPGENDFCSFGERKDGGRQE